jgi:hypothetical protein
MAGIAVVQLQLPRVWLVFTASTSPRSSASRWSVLASLVGGSSPVLASGASAPALLRLLPGPGSDCRDRQHVRVRRRVDLCGRKGVRAALRLRGGTFLTFDPPKVRKYYQQQLTRGPEEVRDSFAGVKP